MGGGDIKFDFIEQWNKSICFSASTVSSFSLLLSLNCLSIDWWETMCQHVPLDNVKGVQLFQHTR